MAKKGLTDAEYQEMLKIGDDAIATAKKHGDELGGDYAKSVSANGDMSGVENIAVDNNEAPTPTPTPAPTPTNPDAPKNVGEGYDGTQVYDHKGKRMGVTQFGGFTRVVDQNQSLTGKPKEAWVRTAPDGKRIVETPKSVQMMELMNRGVTNETMQRAGLSSWDEALQEQNAGKLAKAEAYAQSVRNAHLMSKEQKVKARAKRSLGSGDAFGAALGDLNGEIARGENGSIFDANGKPIDSRVRVSKDGKHIYLMANVEPGALASANENRRKNGGVDDYTAVMAYREIDKNGNPLKDKDGELLPPMLAVTDQPGGDPKAPRRFRKMALRDVANKLLQAHEALGETGDAAKQAVISQLGGWDPNGWQKLMKGESDNWHVDVAKTNADAKVRAAEIAAGAKTDTAKIYSDGRLSVADANNKAMLEKTQMQIDSYAEKNASQERIAESNNNAKKWIADLQSKTTLTKVEMDNEAKTNIATVKAEYEKAIAEGKDDAYIYGKSLDYDAKIAAVKASNMREDAKNALTERLAAEKNAVMLEMAKMKQSVAEGNIELGWGKLKAETDLDEKKLETQKEIAKMNNEAKEKLVVLKNFLGSRDANNLSEDEKKRIKDELATLNKTINDGNLDFATRKKACDRVIELTNQYVGGGDKGEIKSGYNSGNETRTPEQIRANPKDGDTLPLKGGGTARYNASTKKWEKSDQGE